MKGFNKKIIGLLAATMLFYGCEKDDDTLDTMQVKESVGAGCDVITFEGHTWYNDEVDAQSGYGPIAVEGYAVNSNDELTTDNRAMIFDSENWTGDDDDLATEDWGNILIVQQLDDESEPNDNQWGAHMIITFPEPVTLQSMRVIDIDNGVNGPNENLSYVQMFREDGTSVTIPLPQEGDGVGYTLNLQNTENVVRLMVVIDGVDGAVGSGGIDHIVFCIPEEVDEGCTRTQGYWKTHSNYKPKGNGSGKGNSKYDATWDAYLNSTLTRLGSYTYREILWMEPRGGDANLILAHQFIAAELNVAAGASIPQDVLNVWLAAQAYFAGTRSATRAELIAWADILDDYNNGILGPGHCDD